MAAYSDIPLRPMQDLTNFNDDLGPGPVNGTLLQATRMVLEDDNVAEWMVDMLTLNRYYRVKFKKRSTVEKFIGHMAFLSENKENENYTEQQMENMRKVVNDLAKWIDKGKTECLDDSHWPVSSKYVFNLKAIYTAFPTWQDQTYHSVVNWHDRMLDIKEELERETTPERGLSMKDIFESDLRYYQGRNPYLQVQQHVPQHDIRQHDVSDAEMYVDGNLFPPPLVSDIDTDYTVV